MKAPACVAMLVVLASVHALGQVKVDSISNLEQLRRALKAGDNIKIGSTQVDSVRFASEVRISGDRTAVALGGRYTGALALFKPDGTLAAVIETKTIVSSQFAQLDDDGTLGIVTDEVDGIGTGIIVRRFKLYSTTNGHPFNVLWRAPSYVHKAPWSHGEPAHGESLEYGYVRLDPDGSGHPAQMSYAFRDTGGHWSMKLYSLASGSVRELN
jgi:hypothetical protein